MPGTKGLFWNVWEIYGELGKKVVEVPFGWLKEAICDRSALMRDSFTETCSQSKPNSSLVFEDFQHSGGSTSREGGEGGQHM
jgi:hypothetical protein